MPHIDSVNVGFAQSQQDSKDFHWESNGILKNDI